jgi:hypothetical protein
MLILSLRRFATTAHLVWVTAVVAGCENLMLAAQRTQEAVVVLTVQDARYTAVPPPPEVTATAGELRLTWLISDAIVCDLHRAVLSNVDNALSVRVVSWRNPEYIDDISCDSFVTTRSFRAVVRGLPAGKYRVELVRDKTLPEGRSRVSVLAAWEGIVVHRE